MSKLKLKKTILYNEELIVLHICLYHKGLTSYVKYIKRIWATSILSK